LFLLPAGDETRIAAEAVHTPFLPPLPPSGDPGGYQ
jgi:hypothetical protein